MICCVMEYAKIFHTKVTDLYFLCQDCALAADLACPIYNLVVFNLLYCCFPLRVLKIKPQNFTWMCVLDINCYMMLAWIGIYMRVIIQVKIEDIRMPQNTYTLGTARFGIRHINVWEFFQYFSWEYSFCLPLLSCFLMFYRIICENFTPLPWSPPLWTPYTELTSSWNVPSGWCISCS